MNTLRDVVVGDGPADSAVAAALAQQGWDVLFLERDHFLRHKVCGEFLSPEAQTTLRALDLQAAVAVPAPVALTHSRLIQQAVEWRRLV